MGITSSKPKPKNVSTDFKDADLLDMIATKYILTQNFKDMEKLSQKAYCDKLIILTSDVIEKFMNEKTIKYMAEKRVGSNNIPKNFMTKEKIMYFDTADVEGEYSDSRYSKKEIEKLKRRQNETISDQLLSRYQKRQSGGESYSDILQLLGTSDSSRQYNRDRYQPNLKGRKRSVFSELDVRDPTTKLRMCKGIAKFYITIAHLYAAIVKTVNPVYVWKDPKDPSKIHQLDIMNRNKIPKGITPSLMTKNLCTSRINLINPKEVNSEVNINLTKVCNMNLKKRTITRTSDPNRPTQWGQVVENIKTLPQEPGIPQLMQLYNDFYDFTKGSFTKMIPGGAGETQFNTDLKEFYEAFTGGELPYDEWNSDKTKNFSDINLEDYQNKTVCNTPDSNYRKTYTGSEGLFTKYANHVKKMMTTADTNRSAVLAILDIIFKIQTIDNEAKTEVVTINPEINETKLANITAEARKSIVKLYVDCEKDFKEALKIFNAITLIQKVKSTINREKAASAQVDAKIASTPLEKEVFKEISSTLEKKVVPKPVKQPRLNLSNLTQVQKDALLASFLSKAQK